MLKKFGLILVLLQLGCSSTFYRNETAEKVDLKRFMGKWFVIAHIPTFFEKGAYNATEIYTYDAKEKIIEIDFRYNQDSFEGEQKKFGQIGWVYDETSNAHWKVRPFWPLRFNYLIHYVADDYSTAMIGVPDHSSLWFMSRSPTLSEKERIKMEEMSEALGYDLSKLREIPQLPTSEE